MMDAKLKKLVTEDRRLVFLCLLAQAMNCTCNSYVMKDALAGMGHAVSGDQVAADAAWLEEMNLVSVNHNPMPNIDIYKLTSRGRDVALGRAAVPGVKVPEPGLDY